MPDNQELDPFDLDLIELSRKYADELSQIDAEIVILQERRIRVERSAKQTDRLLIQNNVRVTGPAEAQGTLEEQARNGQQAQHTKPHEGNVASCTMIEAAVKVLQGLPANEGLPYKPLAQRIIELRVGTKEPSIRPQLRIAVKKRVLKRKDDLFLLPQQGDAMS